MKLNLKRGGGAGAAIAAAAGFYALLTATVGEHEGLRLKAYKDIAGIPTICYGETLGVKMGQVHSKAECDAMLAKRLQVFVAGVERCISKPMSVEQKVAFTSLSYNIGTGGFCKSTVARKFNAGDTRGACDAMLSWNKARVGGTLRPVKGLTTRRQEERALCLKAA